MIENEAGKIIWNILIIIFMVGCTSLLIDWKFFVEKISQKIIEKIS